MISKEELLANLVNDPEGTKERFKEYWYAWDTFGGEHHEGLIWEIDNGTYHVLCTDGVERAV